MKELRSKYLLGSLPLETTGKVLGPEKDPPKHLIPGCLPPKPGHRILYVLTSGSSATAAKKAPNLHLSERESQPPLRTEQMEKQPDLPHHVQLLNGRRVATVTHMPASTPYFSSP